MRRLVVVGGGISGLAAAWTASRLSAEVPDGLEVVVLEGDPEVGGKARSWSGDGWLLESGPGSFLDGRPELQRLIDESGTAAECTPANEASARRFLVHRGKMREIVTNPLGFARSGILSLPGMLRVLAEPFIPARRDGIDETIWAFAARRLGAEIADRLILPMCLGIFAGDGRLLSLPAAFPRMAALEKESGSLIRAAIRGRRAARRQFAFRHGMQTLPIALARQSRFTVRTSTRAANLARSESGWLVGIGDGSEAIPADAVVLAMEPGTIATLVRPHLPDAASELEAIPCPPVAVVGLGYGPEAHGPVPRGFGVLIARGEGYRMLGNVWDSHLYGGRSPDGNLLIRVMFGGAVDPEAGRLPETELATLAREEVRRLYGLQAAPRFERVVRWSRAIPQYGLGHLDRAARVTEALTRSPGLFLGGSGLHGVSFPDAAATGVRCGEQAVAWLGRPQGGLG